MPVLMILKCLKAGLHKVPYFFKFIKSVEEENLVVKRGKKYHGVGEEVNVKKGKGEAISSFL